ncbi:AAEL013865-PA [Aedes aegypti]|uniref:AAEL013865-PA n=1 Tax=Aedes aegypti TaxID=7159 RepID=Q16HY4_AEDAE|nr:AAEL013865-PA [Aedes aegypti]
MHKFTLTAVLALVCLTSVMTYDPEDVELKNVIPANGTFAAFYPREMYGNRNGNARAPFAHGSFYKNRNPALVDVRNAAAYGYRFDGKRRFNYP